MNNEEAAVVLEAGGIVEFGDRYYKYDGALWYSDYNTRNWKESLHSLEDFRKRKDTSQVEWVEVK